MSRLLQQLPADRAARFAPLLARCRTLDLTAGERRRRIDCAPPAFLVVENGIATVTASCAGAKRRMTVVVAAAGDVLAPPRPGEELHALTDTSITLIPAPVCRVLLAAPEIANHLVERLLEAVSDRQESLAQFAAVTHRDRVREKLLQLARAHGHVASDGIHLDLPLTHELLAQTTGSARETVTGALAALRQEGFLVRDNRCYRLTIRPEELTQDMSLHEADTPLG